MRNVVTYYHSNETVDLEIAAYYVFGFGLNPHSLLVESLPYSPTFYLSTSYLLVVEIGFVFIELGFFRCPVTTVLLPLGSIKWLCFMFGVA